MLNIKKKSKIVKFKVIKMRNKNNIKNYKQLFSLQKTN